MRTRRTETEKIALCQIVVLIAICLAYLNSFQNGFHFDDSHTVVDNPAIRSLRNVPRFFTDASTFSVFPPNRTYRPMVSTMLAVDYALGQGYKPFWFHLSTFLLFLLLVAILFKLYRIILVRCAELAGMKYPIAVDWIALVAAAFFGLHPVMAETVNYVIQRGDLYCTLGCVAALYLYARYPKLRSTGLYLLPYALGLLSKPPAAVFPGLLLLYVYFFEPGVGRLPKRIRESVVSAVPAIAVNGLLLWLQSAMTPKSFQHLPLAGFGYRVTQPYVWARYVGEVFLPIHLNVDTDLQTFHQLNLKAWFGMVFLLGLLLAIAYCVRRPLLYPIGFGLLWFVVTQLPTSLYPLYEVENDHRMFFSYVGLVLAVVWAAWLALQHLPHILKAQYGVLAAIVVVVLAAYGYGAHRRNAVWHDEESLWRDDVLKAPHNGRGLMIYGLSQMNKGNYPVALDYFTRALTYSPEYPLLEVNLGVVNGAMADAGEASRSAEAERHFLRAVALAPKDEIPHTYYGRWLKQQGRTEEAIHQLQLGVALNPARTMPRELLIEAYGQDGKPAMAREAALETLRVAPDDVTAQQALLHPPVQNAGFWINLSLAQYKQAKYVESIASAQRALQINPNSAEAYNNIGAGYGALGHWEEAIQNEREALRLKPSFAIAQNNLNWYLQAKKDAEKGLGSAPVATMSAADWVNRSLQLNQAGNYPASITAAQEALHLNPCLAEAWNNIAAADESMHRWDEAIVAAKKAIALKPDFQLAKNNLAWSLEQKAQQH